ncbi:tRNA-dihydrouridine synthase [Candidatus Nomurabacteria bacterium]|nr:tRNA-dihydrouridine synthase [Candidatus Nomurabacteria bacterium]
MQIEYGFWEQFKKKNRGDNNPFFVLAPMADVTDAAFRRIVTTHGKPDVLWTEFVSADGLMSPGREVLARDLVFTEAERPIVAQLFSAHPDMMRGAVKLCALMGFDGIDINMGCPDKSIEKQGAGAGMIKTPDIAVSVINAAKAGIEDAFLETGKRIPLSVKTRIGYNKNEIDTWIPLLLSQGLAALTVHARTRKELSLVPARWEHVREVVDIRNKMGVETVIIGNGDVKDIEDGKSRAQVSDCDGVMIGRAIFGNPWLFAKDQDKKTVYKKNLIKDFFRNVLVRVGLVKDRYWLNIESDISVHDRLMALVEHATLFEKLLGDIKSFAIMKKHFKAYVHGFGGAKELRVKLMEEGNTARDVKRIIEEFL